jgi:CheY-like chemotaxis protein
MTVQDTAITTEAPRPPDMMLADRSLLISRQSKRPGSGHAATCFAASRRMPLILVLEDGQAMSEAMREMCEFLDVTVNRIDSHEDLLPFLQGRRPMAVVAAMDALGQDGGNVLMTVARHDPSLPVLLVTNDDPALAGAADAVTTLWGLTEVVQTAAWPSPGEFAEFLCLAGLRGSCLGLLPV